VKIKTRPDEASVPQKTGWFQMGDWLARLRDDGRGEPAGNHDPRPEAPAEAADAEAAAQAGGAEADVRAETMVRAVIGDQLRMPIMWCEMGSCISWYAHPAALGEADTRARAIDVGWRIDALGRLACPQCQQNDPGFWSARPVAVWDRYMAIARAARFTGWRGNGTDGSAGPESGRDARRPSSPLEPGWHRQFPAAQAMPAVTAANAPPVPPFARHGLECGPGLARLRGQPDGTRPADGIPD
jgi:hypothetical protein